MADLSRSLQMTGLTDAGLVRDHNEDALGFDPTLGYAVLADGMGGYNAGEVASGIAVQMLAHTVREGLSARAAHLRDLHGVPHGHSLLETAVQRANAAIYGTALAQPQCAGMGTTLVVALFFDNRVVLAHVGDSRCYRLRDGVLQQLTRDHSFLQEQLDSGLITPEEARYAGNKNLVTRAVGIDPDVETELNDFAAAPGDLYLLCSDGLNDMIEDDEIAEVLSGAHHDLPGAAAELVGRANAAGGRDNVSVLLVAIRKPYPAQPALWRKMSSLFGNRS
ncbi:Stp1/IreP family PP2C-type Ser/Thr phosphatase [Chitiniphilus purpureus]|uniref:Stp1/IreP family PP2C-type Ser/Thr phosphatase n=1 Tax=Chitiniphilus purpureus TaxID=2981137 RepID=A0ABY6DRT3_9NEIS|nr:Stp1/IreP family PP2C-type Ser/Thr phosphatase [Chitiniphilus sp. CD1]UXY16181.1 Stp1/IreP family PP2C-type Ser/Thr phosphatase [Chitiniphilus sp. CD1]